MFASSTSNGTVHEISIGSTVESDGETYVVAPGGYRIRVPRPQDADQLGELLPSVKQGLSVVPPLPDVVFQLLREIQSSNSSASSVGTIAASDPAMAASLIRAVNSAAFSLSRKITSVPEAVNYLGFSSVKSLVLRLQLDQTLAVKAGCGDEVQDLWIHSLMVSYIAETLARRVPQVDAGFVSTLGLLHDLGRLVLFTQFPEEAKALRESSSNGDEGVLQRETRVLGADHAELGAKLASQWNLPADLVRAIRWHHVPQRAFEPSDPKPLHQAVYIVQVANQLAKYCYTYSEQIEFESDLSQALEALGFANDVPALLDADVCAAAGRAIFFADQTNRKQAFSIRPFLRLRTDESAQQLLGSLGSTPAGKSQVNIDDELCESLFAEATKFAGRTSADGIDALYSKLLGAMEKATLSSAAQATFPMVARCVLANTIQEKPEPIEIALSTESGHAQLAIRSSAISFVRRFGESTHRTRRCWRSGFRAGQCIELGMV